MKLCSNKLIPSEGKTNSSLKYQSLARYGSCKTIKNKIFKKYLCFRAMYGRYPVLRSVRNDLSLARQNKFPGVGQMFRYTLRDESNHIELFRNLFGFIDENPDIWTEEFKRLTRTL